MFRISRKRLVKGEILQIDKKTLMIAIEQIRDPVVLFRYDSFH